MLDYSIVPVPTEFPVPPVNCIIIFNEPLTIIDPGIRREKTRNLLEQALQVRGKTLKDVQRIILTHGHIDHFGISGDLNRQYGTPVYIHKDDMGKILSASREHTAGGMKEILLMHGVPEKDLVHIDSFMHKSDELIAPLDQAEPLGESIDFENESLRVIHSPGHSSGSVVLYHEQEKLLFSGDTILKHITPNPVYEQKSDGSRLKSLLAFHDTMEKLSKLTYSCIIPGHGEWIYDFQEIHQRYENSWQKRKQKILKFISENQPLSAYSLAGLLFRKLENLNVYLGVSEVIGYLDWLEADGSIRLDGSHPVIITAT